MAASGGEGHDVVAAAVDAGMRLDRLLVGRLPGYSRARLQALIRAGAVASAGVAVDDPGHKVKAGATYRVRVPEAVAAEPAPEAIDLHVVYEDEALIVIDKPAGLTVHPAPGHATGTLVNALIAHCGASLSGIGGVKRPGIVHRLDKDTTGLMVVAKTDRAHHSLAEQFASHGADGRLERGYRALVWGVPERVRGEVDAPLGRSRTNRTRMAVVPESAGRRAVTHYEVVETYGPAGGKPVVSQLALTLETGRTHQVRVHMAHIGHPLLGDQAYGAGFKASASLLPEAAQAALAGLGRQALHAAVLAFEHPLRRRRLRFTSQLPADMAQLAEALKGFPSVAKRRLRR